MALPSILPIARRHMLLALGGGVLAGSVAPVLVPAYAAGEADDPRRKARYRESDLVKTYYRVNRYPK